MDKRLVFSAAQTVTKTDGNTQVSTNVVDLGASEKDNFGNSLTPDIGEAGELIWVVSLDAAITGEGATVVCALVTKAADASIGTSGTTLASITIPALSAAGTRYATKVPYGTIYRYTGVVYTATGGDVVGTEAFDSYLTLKYEKLFENN